MRRAIARLDVRSRPEHETPQGGIGDQRRVRPHDVEPARKIPVKVAMDGGMVEAGERAAQLAEPAAEIREEREGLVVERAERRAGQP